jgi:hypothetical protein
VAKRFKPGDYAAEDDHEGMYGPYRSEDAAYRAFFLRAGFEPLRVVRLVKARRGGGMDVVVVWERED